MLDKRLQEFGLSDKEAKIYLALLELEQASVVELSRKTGINRVTMYSVLDQLQKKGLVSQTDATKKSKFLAEPPERLALVIERNIKELELKKTSLDQLVKDLDLISNQPDKPIVRFFRGDEGISSMFEEFVYGKKPGENKDSPQNILYTAYSRDVQAKTTSPETLNRRRKIRDDSEIRTVNLYNLEEGDKIPSDAKRKRIRVDYPLPAHIGVYQDKIRLLSYKSKQAILIVAADLAQTLRSIMRLAEKAAEEESQ